MKKKEPLSKMFVVEQGGFQYAVAEGDRIRVPRIDVQEGTEITLGRVLMMRNGDTVKVGTPHVDGAEVRAKVVGHGKYDKIFVMKKRRRKNYKRKSGHRQGFTTVQITSVSA